MKRRTWWLLIVTRNKMYSGREHVLDSASISSRGSPRKVKRMSPGYNSMLHKQGYD
jgi:hypothetical protein